MKYIALIRGINIGGHRKISMIELKKALKSLGLSDVVTYINSGNVIFSENHLSPEVLAKNIEKVIEQSFHFEVPVLIRSVESISQICEEIPVDWGNDPKKIPQVIFLGSEIDAKGILDAITVNTEIEGLQYFPGALVWDMDRETYNKSAVYKFISSTKITKQVTVRTLRTVKKLHQMMAA